MTKAAPVRINPYILDNHNLTLPLSRNIETYPEGIIILLNKPCGWTSADVVRRVKFSLQRWFSVRKIKVGHAGTLDPLATGVLIVCIGKATKLAEHYQSQNKGYMAEITFGATTPSYDLEKEIDATYPTEHITLESINKVLPQFLGEIDQIPPLYSAKLIDGNRAYDIARSGNSATLKPSRITIHSLKTLSYSNKVLELEIMCSKGTYVRSVARDLGEALSSGAHLSNLIRISSGNFLVKNAISINNLKLFLQ